MGAPCPAALGRCLAGGGHQRPVLHLWADPAHPLPQPPGPPLNALAGSLGGAILFLAFVYYGAQVGLLAAEFAKHRLLVRAGAAPRSPVQWVSGLLVRLWTVEEAHHDEGLPYQPSRLEPVQNGPTNTRDEVLFKQRQAQAHAAQDAGRSPAAALHTHGPTAR